MIAPSERASVSSDWTRRSVRSSASWTASAIERSSALEACGSASVTSSSVRMTVSGVRSSCEALATKRRWLAKAPDRRSSISSKVSASSLSSSRGPSSAMRSSSVSCETPRAAAVIFCSGRSARPATSQPSSTDSAVIAASASAYCTRRCESASSATSCWMARRS